MKTVLTIAGSDSSGGAGIQADLKTITALHCYGMSAITALTAQNTMGVTGIEAVPADFVVAQIRAVFDDIRPDAVKVGMIGSAETAHAIAATLAAYDAQNIVLDPVMVATSGAELASNEVVEVLKEELIPLAKVVTPNIPEAEVLCGMTIKTEEDQVAAAQALLEMGAGHALVKGGHNTNDANDVFVGPKVGIVWLRGERIETTNTHGTGCTLSSAIACGLAQGGMRAVDASRAAKEYLTGALAAGLNLGQGSGPLDHMWNM